LQLELGMFLYLFAYKLLVFLTLFNTWGNIVKFPFIKESTRNGIENDAILSDVAAPDLHNQVQIRDTFENNSLKKYLLLHDTCFQTHPCCLIFLKIPEEEGIYCFDYLEC